jgi:hypothetical protein
LANYRWRQKAKDLVDLQQHIARVTATCYREPKRLLETRDFEPYKELLSCSSAFGQFLDTPATDAERLRGQFGLYGTAAALELLSAAPSAAKLASLDHTAPDPSDADWARRFLSTWLFFRLTILNLGAPDSTKFWIQDRNTLRLCRALSSLARIKDVLRDLNGSRVSKLLKDDELATKLEIGDGGLKYLDIVEAILERLDRAVITRAPPEVAAGLKNTNVRSVVFAIETDDIAERKGVWLFLWSSYLRAIAEAFAAGLLSTARLSAQITREDLINLKLLLREADPSLDPRYILFGLYGWSVVVLNLLPEELALGDDHEWFTKRVRRLVLQLSRDDVRLLDLHSPYQIYFKDAPGGPKYHDDYFIIPTLPIVIELMSTVQARLLFRPRVVRLLDEILAVASDGSSRLGRLPGQLTELNGTVNVAYISRAAAAAAKAIKDRASLAWVLSAGGYVMEHWRGIAIGSGLLSALFATAYSTIVVVTQIGEKVLTLAAWETGKRLVSQANRKWLSR